MKYFTYILQSLKDGRFYIGQSQDLEKRINRHNKGTEKYTRKYCPWNLVWYSEFDDRKLSFGLEQKLKNYKSRERILKFMKEHPVPGSENLQIFNLIDFRESTKK